MRRMAKSTKPDCLLITIEPDPKSALDTLRKSSEEKEEKTDSEPETNRDAELEPGSGVAAGDTPDKGGQDVLNGPPTASSVTVLNLLTQPICVMYQYRLILLVSILFLAIAVRRQAVWQWPSLALMDTPCWMQSSFLAGNSMLYAGAGAGAGATPNELETGLAHIRTLDMADESIKAALYAINISNQEIQSGGLYTGAACMGRALDTVDSSIRTAERVFCAAMWTSWTGERMTPKNRDRVIEAAMKTMKRGLAAGKHALCVAQKTMAGGALYTGKEIYDRAMNTIDWARVATEKAFL